MNLSTQPTPGAVHNNPPLLQTHSPSAAWLGSAQEPALDPQRRIIDPHHHFSHHWGGYGLDDLLRDTGAGHRIESTVYVQCGWEYRQSGDEMMKPVGETDAVVRLAEAAKARGANTDVAAGIVGFADLLLGDAVEPVLGAQIDAGKGRFRGIRFAASRHESFQHGVLPRPPVGLYANNAFRAGVRQLARLGLTFDAWVYHTQLQDVIELARSVPESTIVVDHIGGLLGVGPYAERQKAAFDEWLPLLAPLAACPNIVMKIGGYGTTVFGYDFISQPNPPSSATLADAWRPTVTEVIETFGASRCMFESNFPVDRASASYATVWNAFKRLAVDASESEKQDLFYNTAARTYRIGDAGR
ncbi:Predicted metal-dependent hydrolase, TIM-barrel fold [Paraburkholderia fungorum]|uniref:Predicted metal-dependent hydrolase, TIM-barrel fold n=1 Tax=Paraburkholderia fungorum TaxID=134537 RepID=A0A1H1JE42_9BURK|nr:amidohydrolase family protein [Paraburkholderia fungorum]SDR48201.1 Predicted metal-dependent hydrolase, TIM-barrel fold [Paraburkholderia fungorum]